MDKKKVGLIQIDGKMPNLALRKEADESPNIIHCSLFDRRIHVVVCANNCRRGRRCGSYKAHCQKNLFVKEV